jgi:ribosome-associated toxin RatA of RatAB toxin-antitoxin module
MRPASAATRIAALLAALGCAGAACAAQIESFKVSHDGDRYHIEVHARLAVPAAAAYRAFADPAQLQAINPAVQHMEVLKRVDDQAARLYSEVHVCAGPFCKTLHQVQDMSYHPRADGGDLHADVLGGQGDFRSGRGDWQFQPAGDQATELHFSADLEPNFWVPPLVGPWIVESAFRDEAERTSEGIERVAAARQ